MNTTTKPKQASTSLTKVVDDAQVEQISSDIQQNIVDDETSPKSEIVLGGSNVNAESGDDSACQDAPGAVEAEITGHSRQHQEGSSRGPTSSFDLLKKGWEAYVAEQARNVQRASQSESFQPLQMLQNLSLCGAGEGLARITGQSSGLEEDDPFAPIVLRHTHSTPLQYSASMFDDAEQPPPPIGFGMRRSSSTPSSSAFRQRSEGSAFGTHLRAMPHLRGEGSAFSLPAQRTSSASRSDSGVRYSAFDPFLLSQDQLDVGEGTAIEVMDLGPASTEETNTKRGATARAARFLRMRRGRRRSGRENPARPPSTPSVSIREESINANDSMDTDSISSKSSVRPSDRVSSSPKETIGLSQSSRTSERVPFPSVPEIEDEDAKNVERNRHGSPGAGHYEQLDSDIDEEYEHMQAIEGIEASLTGESPTATPSPAYQQFVDEHMDSLGRRSVDADSRDESKLPTVRLQVESIATTPPQTRLIDRAEGSSHTPSSQDSGTQSSGTTRSSITQNTSGHTTLATSTTATVSSTRSHISVLSSVSEADMEVMETNQAGKQRIRQEQKMQRAQKGDLGSVASVSTASTNTHGYVALAGSPAPLREGASLPVDRFFGQSRIPVSHSTSINSGSTGSSGGSANHVGSATKKGDSPHTVSSNSMANTSSSSSAGEEPPKIVSYSFRTTKAQRSEKSDAMSLPSVSEREASVGTPPAEIVGYSEMVFEEAEMPADTTTTHPTVIRPAQKSVAERARLGSRPPLSPAKGLRTPTTPPPSALAGGPDSTDFKQFSPPRNIVDHHMRADVSKPYAVFRSTARSTVDRKVLVSPAVAQGSRRSASVDGADKWAQEVVTRRQLDPTEQAGSIERGQPVYTYGVDELRESPILRDQTCKESSIEVKDKTGPKVVTPDKPS